MRKIIRFLLALILGFIAFEVVDLWPVRPMWSKPFSKMAIVGFSGDEKYLFILEGMHRLSVYNRGSMMNFVKYEIATGAEKQRTELCVPRGMDRLDVSASADCRKLLFYGYKDSIAQTDYLCYLFDGQTGQSIGGPWECGDFRDVLLSPDARWICHPGKHPNSSYSSLTLISSENGQAVFSSPTIAGSDLGHPYLFSQDGSKLAVLTTRRSTLNLKIISVPSGEVLNSFEISNETLFYLSDWSDDIISLKHFSHGAQSKHQGIQSFRIENAKLIPLDREPLLQIENDDIVDSSISAMMKTSIISHARQGKAAWPEYYLRLCEWCDGHLGTHWGAGLYRRITFRCFDRQTGKFRLDIPVDDIVNAQYNSASIINASFSSSGRYFASYAGETPLLEVWNVNPFPRWPWAVGAGLLMALVVWFFPSMRRRLRVPMTSKNS